MAEQDFISLDERAATFYRDNYNSLPPHLSVGDKFRLPDYPTDTFTVMGFRAGGMLVDAVRDGSTQELNFPRRYTPARGESFYLGETQ